MKINKNLLPDREVASTWFGADINGLPNGIVRFTNINSNSNRLTLTSDGGVRIGANVNHVLVSANLFFNFVGSTQNYVWTRISNGTGEISTAISPWTSAMYTSTSHSTKLANVQEGDVIYLRGLESKIGWIRGYGSTWLTVEIID